MTSPDFKWADRVVDIRNGRFRGRLGKYRSACGNFPGWHNILWSGRQTTERVPTAGFEHAEPPRLPGDPTDAMVMAGLEEFRTQCVTDKPLRVILREVIKAAARVQ